MLKNVTATAIASAESFLELSNRFKLGSLQTEQQAPETLHLAENSKGNIILAWNQIKSLDKKTIDVLLSKIPELTSMYQQICDTLTSKNRIFICGCGATGRLSLALEQLFRQEAASINQNHQHMNSVISLMAGGDLALIKSVEDFEDHPEFAVQHMKDLHFGQNDLLIASTEGGETPWVIGATNYAAEFSSRRPFFLYGNPDDVLVNVLRSKEVIDNDRIIKINLSVGPMGITGSTRMQSTTILMYAIGLPLLHAYPLTNQPKEIADATFESTAVQKVKTFAKLLEDTNFAELITPFTVKESEIYQNEGHIFYETTSYFGLSVLTDTTERSPTFSLFPFENQQDKGTQLFVPSLCHLVMKGSQKKNEEQSTGEAAWEDLLGDRPIRGLDNEYWKNYENKVATKRAIGYNFSEDIVGLRKGYTKEGAKHFYFEVKRRIEEEKSQIWLDFQIKGDEYALKTSVDVSCFNGSRLCESMMLKVILNTHSTLVMCRLDKVKSNIMIWVRPSNFKLIDRAIRYIQYFLTEQKDRLVAINAEAYEKAVSYDQVCIALMSETEKLQYGQAIVLRTVARVLNDCFDITE